MVQKTKENVLFIVILCSMSASGVLVAIASVYDVLGTGPVIGILSVLLVISVITGSLLGKYAKEKK